MLAGLLFFVPWWILRDRGITMEELGAHTGSWRSTVTWSLGTMLVVFPLFAAGHHLVMTGVMDRELNTSAERWTRWDQALEGLPAHSCAERETLIAFTDSRGLWVLGPTRESVELQGVWSAGRHVTCEREKLPVASTPRRPDREGRLRLAPGEGILLPLEARAELHLEATTAGGTLVPGHRILSGAYGQKSGEDGVVSGARDLWWILPFLVVQLGLVALPEEWFFRGYLQARMDQRWGTPWTFLGTSFGPGLLAAALAFALLHPILIPGAHRLLVFFPALLFGWLRARNGHIGAAMVVHAGSNLLLELLTGLYA